MMTVLQRAPGDVVFTGEISTISLLGPPGLEIKYILSFWPFGLMSFWDYSIFSASLVSLLVWCSLWTLLFWQTPNLGSAQGLRKIQYLYSLPMDWILITQSLLCWWESNKNTHCVSYTFQNPSFNPLWCYLHNPESQLIALLIFSCKHGVVGEGSHLIDLLLFVLPLSSFPSFPPLFLPLTLPPSPLPSFPVPRPYRPCSSWWLPSRCLSTFGATRTFPTSTGMKKRLQLYWKPGRGDTLR